MIEVIEAPGPEVERAILAPLVAYNERVAGPADYSPVAIVLRDPGTGEIVGGLWGGCFYDWMVVKLLAVPEAMRGRGHGRALMLRAESLARDKGAAGLWLDTFSFQARGFYEKLGFTCFGELPGHPRGGARFFMQKPI